jgi:polyisoprenoid-binding protein YceI
MRALLLILGLAAAATPATAAPERYRIDPVHSQALFFCSHLGFSRAIGVLPDVDGTLTFDPDDWSRAEVDATIDVGRLYLGDAEWQKKMLSDEFFDVERHPTMHFRSERVEATGAERARVHGQLTLHGITRPVTLEVQRNRVGRHTYSLKYVAGFSATARLKRSEFGMRRLLPAVGDEVEIVLEIEALRERHKDPRP